MPTCPAPVRPLDDAAAAELTSTAAELLARHGSATAPSLLEALPEACAALSDNVRHALRPVDTADGLFVVRGLRLDDTELGATPGHWSTVADAGAVWDVVLLLVSALMGTPIAWDGQQDGRFVHNIVPSPGHESEQTGASSSVLLTPHTEDAFHPGRAHLLLLACMRNHDRIATTAASIRRTELSDDDITQLTRPVAPILPDDAYEQAQQFAGRPSPVPTLFDTPEGLTMRFDPAYTPMDEADEAWREAYGRLEEELARVSVAVSLEPGDVLVVDNDIVVHGRVPFRARYDGTDRWLKRASVRVEGRPTRPLAEHDEHGYGQAALTAWTD
ncbi:TfdA family taurine catabolism dioxygenase TauD [Streptomyces sp. CG 926]|uniref:TauD/TfdA family dioxygenase n=1 Tax=Streptomyces sp. CG 926 TaxID=1882405 RepID=UPI000D6B391A|nr:TauD/TfdA family dioxygenase [Streptomyces sp. CG 926]PWK64480.1 TfdA family taurine catabolism dioxygenase TauD [Streptomyces sp. CG 926]